MPPNDAWRGRVKLAARILLGIGRQGPPATLNQIAELRFLAESDEERDMPVERLARVVIERESKRAGKAPSGDSLRAIGRN